MADCIFCKIINNEVPSDKVAESDTVLAFHDIQPKAPTHILIVPKVHIASVASEGSEVAAGDLVKMAKQVAKELHIPGYKLVFHVGREGGQIVDHLHLHFLSGKITK